MVDSDPHLSDRVDPDPDPDKSEKLVKWGGSATLHMSGKHLTLRREHPALQNTKCSHIPLLGYFGIQ